MSNEPRMSPEIAKIIDRVYLGFLKQRFEKVFCPECDKGGNPVLGLKLNTLTEATTGREYIYAVCPVCNSHYNLADMNCLKAFQRLSFSGKRKPLINLQNLPYSDRYKLD